MSAKTPKQKKIKVKILKGHEVNIYEQQSIRELCKLGDGFLASRGNGDRNIRIWDITTGKCIQIIDTGITVTNDNNIKTMVHISSEMSPNLIAFVKRSTNESINSNNEIGICNYITGEILDQNPCANIRNHIPLGAGQISIQEICGFYANIAFIVRTQINRPYICIWNTDINDYANAIALEGINPFGLCSVGDELLAFTDNTRIQILNWTNAVLRNIGTTFTNPLYYLEYIGNGKILVADRGSLIEIINIDTLNVLSRLSKDIFGTSNNICHLNNNYVALYTDSRIAIWNVETGAKVNELRVDISIKPNSALTYLGDNRIAIAGYINEGRKKQKTTPVIQIIDTNNTYLDVIFSQFVRGTGKSIVIPGKRKKNEPKVIPPLPADPLRIIYSFLKENPIVPKEKLKKKSLSPINASSSSESPPYMDKANYEKRTKYLFEQLAKGKHPSQKAAKHATRERSPYVSPVSEEEKVFIPDIIDIANANIDPKTQTRRKRKVYKKLQEIQAARDKLAKLYSRKLKKDRDTLYRKLATSAGIKQLTQDKKAIIENAIEKASVSGEVDEDDLIEKLQDDVYTRLRKRANLKTLHYTKKRVIDNAIDRASVSGEVDEDDLVRILKLPVDRSRPLPKVRVKLPARKTVTKKLIKKSVTVQKPSIQKSPAQKPSPQRPSAKKPSTKKSSTKKSSTKKPSAYNSNSSDL